jgi:hypothetical protein
VEKRTAPTGVLVAAGVEAGVGLAGGGVGLAGEGVGDLAGEGVGDLAGEGGGLA